MRTRLALSHILAKLARPFAALLLATIIISLVVWNTNSVQAAVSDISVTIYAAPNLIVDSNVLSPSTQAPEVATVIGRFCNTSGAAINDVAGYIGNYDSATPANSTPGVYPAKTNVTIGGQLYSGTYQFNHLGGVKDATRIIGSLAPGQCKYQYWSFAYPQTANGGTIASWGGSVKPDDDLSLDFDIWAAEGTVICNSAACNKTHTATMRNEISAMANKISPNGNPGGEWFNTNAETVNVGETITTNGIRYRLGRVNQGFDNNGDFVPDYNAWLQPIGNPTYDPSCFRLIDVSGTLTVTRSSGSPDMIIPFSHALNQANDAPLLYFTDLPTDNTDVNGLVYYTFMALGGPCTIPISPYQEVASGSDNEKFNGDYGSGGPSKINTYAPEIAFDKSGPLGTTEGGGPYTYNIAFQNTGTAAMGLSLSTGANASFVISDSVPVGLQYVIGSAAAGNTAPPANSYTIYYSTNSGLTWTTTDPGTVTSTALNQIVIQWWLNEPLGTGQSGAVTFQAQVPSGYINSGGDPFIENCADARLGTGSNFAEDCTTTTVAGNNALGDTVWQDDGLGGGVSNNGLQDGTEAGIAGVTVYLYWDRDGNGQLEETDPLVGTTTTGAAATSNYAFSSLPDGNYIVKIDPTDPLIPTGYAATTPKQYAISLDPTHASATGVTNNTADFGFGPPLILNKYLLSGSPAYEGDNLTYRIDLKNDLPGDGTVSGFCQYTVWARIAHLDNTNNPPGGTASNAQWQNTANALNAFDTLYASTQLSDNSDLLGLSGFNTANQGGAITSVQFVAYAKELTDLKSTDAFRVRVWYTPGGTGTGSALATYNYLGDGTGDGAYFTSPVGTVYQVAKDITALRSWSWPDFASNVTEMQVEGSKGSGGGASGDIALDAAAYIITTDEVCGGADSAITTLPLTDTYDATKLQFVSASPTPTTVTPAGTLTWANLGPLYAGQTKSVTVVFKALDPGASSVVTVNTAAVSGAKFGNGRDTNTPPNAAANATINPTGSISGVVWSDGSGGTTGWVGAAGYENLGTTDFGIQGVTMTLFGCQSSAGVLFTTIDTAKTCAGQGSGAGWVSMGTTTTAADGSYSFTGLRMGYYYVGVTAGLPGGATQSAEPIYNGTGLTCGTANATCAGNWNPTGAATTVNNTNLSVADFNPIGNNNPLTTPNEDITNVNFGYSSVPALIFGKVFTDSNGDGFQTSGEADLSGITVRLCADSACAIVINTTATDSSGQYSFTGFTTPGTYYVVVTPPGSVIQTADPDQVGTCSTCDNRTNAITISAGQTKGSYDFGYQPNGVFSIGDTLYVDWDGSGAQDTGEEGIANVTVYLYEDENGNGAIDAGVDALITTTTTNASGNYLFGNRPNGSYLIVVDTSDSDFPTTYTPTQDLDGGADSKATVTLAGGDNLNVDFGYQPTGFGSIGDYVWHDQNGDGLQTNGEPGINSVLVRLYQDENGDGAIDGTDAVVASQTTSGGGLYNFTDLVSGNYIVEIVQSNFAASQPLDAFTITTSGAAYTSTSTQVSYRKSLGTEEAFLNADFGFAQGLIGDFIWRDDNGNGTPDTGEPGINAVAATLYNDVNMNGVYDAGTDTFQAATATDSSGYYQFGGLPAGDYVVVVTPPINYTLTGDPDAYSNNPASFAYPPCNPADTVNYSYCDHQYGVTLYAGQVDRTADFGYKPLGVIGDTLWVDGNDNGIQDPGEAGIPFITVNLCSALPCTGGNILATTSTDADGKYSFGGLGDNTYFVAVDAADPDFPVGLTQSYDPDGTADNTASSIVISSGVVTSIGGTPCANCDLNSDFGYRFAGTNNVSGRVWHDDDQGGQTGGIGDIDDPSGIFYANVAVYLWNCGTGTCSDGDETLAGITATDSGGQYSFANLADGNYAVAINNNDIYLSGTDPTTPNAYDSPAASWIVLSGGTNAVRDFGRFSNIDLGDLPISYNNTILGDNGPRHRLVASGQVTLGTAIDADPNGQESANAFGDDTDVDGNDDDGVSRSGTNWSNGADGGAVTVTADCPSAPCYLSAWIDWNRDNVFSGSSEQILLDYPVNDGAQLIQFDIPTGTFSGSGSNVTFNARFRLYQSSTASLAQPTGYAVNGEVEDYQWSFTPTAISLRQLRVSGFSDGSVQMLILVAMGLAVTIVYWIDRKRHIFNR